MWEIFGKQFDEESFEKEDEDVMKADDVDLWGKLTMLTDENDFIDD